MSWNVCHIVVDENHSKETIASALRRLADLVEGGAFEGVDVIALRAADGRLVDAASLSRDPTM